MAAVDRELGYAGLKSYAWTTSGTPFVVVLFALAAPTRIEAVIEADKLGQLRTGAASGVAARYLAREGAASLGVIGAGRQAATQIACIRAAVPTIEHVSVYARNAERLAEFCREHGCEPAESHREAADADIVVTVTTSKDPVLRGEWLREGALVCAVGANDPRRRELDNAVLERAAFVCCDSREQSQQESGDLIEPVEQGVLDWLEVHELQEIVTGELRGRESPEDIVLFKSNGIAAWDLAVGRARGRARARARRRNRGSRPTGRRCRRPMRGDEVVAERVQDVRPVEQALDLLGREPVRDVGVLEDVVERAAAMVLADQMLGADLLPARTWEEEAERRADEIRELSHRRRFVTWPWATRGSHRESGPRAGRASGSRALGRSAPRAPPRSRARAGRPPSWTSSTCTPSVSARYSSSRRWWRITSSATFSPAGVSRAPR